MSEPVPVTLAALSTRGEQRRGVPNLAASRSYAGIDRSRRNRQETILPKSSAKILSVFLTTSTVMHAGTRVPVLRLRGRRDIAVVSYKGH